MRIEEVNHHISDILENKDIVAFYREICKGME